MIFYWTFFWLFWVTKLPKYYVHNSLFIFYFVLPILPWKRKTLYKKTRNLSDEKPKTKLPKYVMSQALTPLQRVLPNADQILTPRRAKNRGPLPSARLSSFVKIWYYELTKAIWVSSFRRRDTKLDIFLTQTQRPW